MGTVPFVSDTMGTVPIVSLLTIIQLVNNIIHIQIVQDFVLFIKLFKR